MLKYSLNRGIVLVNKAKSLNCFMDRKAGLFLLESSLDNFFERTHINETQNNFLFYNLVINFVINK